MNGGGVGTQARQITRTLVILLTVGLAGCATVSSSKECELPALTPDEVEAIARHHLEALDVNKDFLAEGESRVTRVGCRYDFELAESLDSFGQAILVEVSRKREVTNARSGH